METKVIKGGIMRADLRDVVLIKVGHRWSGCIAVVVGVDDKSVNVMLKCPPDVGGNVDRRASIEHGEYTIVGKV